MVLCIYLKQITDFGLSYVKGGTGLDVNMMQSKCGTPLYMGRSLLFK